VADGEGTAQPAERILAGRYFLRGELGRGGMGIVWWAEDRMIGRPVAVKEVRLGADVSLEERILREARTAGRLNHPGVVTVFDIVRDDGSIFIVMELVEAPNLTALVRSSGPLAPAVVAEIGQQVLSALEAAHATGIVHRDVKPSNIMVLGNGRVKLADFGIARVADDPTLTSTGVLVGSPAYVAPEQLNGSQASAASDVWALGAALFFAVEGRPAFERDTTAATLNAVLHEVPYLTRCQGPLAAAISGMLVAAPEARLSGESLRQLLAEAAQSPPTIPYQQQMWQPQPPTPRRSRAPIYTVLAVVAALGLGVGGFFLGQSMRDKPAASVVRVITIGPPHGDIDNADFPYPGSGSPCLSGPLPIAKGNTYPQTDCAKPHSLEIYAAVGLADTRLDQLIADKNDSGSDLHGTIYPGADRLAAVASTFCHLHIPMAKDGVATPKNGDSYSYAAVVPSEWNWTGSNLEKDTHATQGMLCVVWKNGGQLPASKSGG
jgi:serine/threonine protein kinase